MGSYLKWYMLSIAEFQINGSMEKGPCYLRASKPDVHLHAGACGLRTSPSKPRGILCWNFPHCVHVGSD